MVVLDKDVTQGIRNLIFEITGFGEEEENFYICEQYCLSHVMHHTYPSINKKEVKDLIDGYILRFFIHGYFKVADGLDTEVKKFLNNEFLFKKNPQFDIQWVLLSLLSGLASNLTEVSKLPKMIPVDEEEMPFEEINWGQYLKLDLPNYEHEDSTEENDSDELSFRSQNSEVVEDVREQVEPSSSNSPEIEAESAQSTMSLHPSRQHIIDELVKGRENEINYSRDIVIRGNFIEEVGLLVNINTSSTEILSEFEIVGYVLKQFLTGEDTLRKKGILNPATCSLTKVTVRNYLNFIQPYVNMIRDFKEFSNKVSSMECDKIEQTDRYSVNEIRTPRLSIDRGVEKGIKSFKNCGDIDKINPVQKAAPTVIKLYNLALSEALKSFESKIITMAEYQNSYTLLRVLNELRPSFGDLSSLYGVHLSATANWLDQPNWLCSVRILSTLFNAILNSSSNRLGFLYVNMFLCCFQAYLDITDNWISCLTLNDPYDEYIIYRWNESDENSTYRIRPYRQELSTIGLKQFQMLDFLANKMIHVGHSIDILNRLDRSVIINQKHYTSSMNNESFHTLLLKKVKQEIGKLSEDLSDKCQQLSHIKGKETTLHSDKELYKNPHNGTDKSDDNNNSNINSNTEETEQSDRICDNFFLEVEVAISDFCIKLCQTDTSGIIENSIWPLTNIINSNVRNLLNERVLQTCDLAKDVVVNQFQLKIHLGLLRNIFLFNAPHFIQSFMSGLFSQQLLRQNCYLLTLRLRESIEKIYRDQAEYLSVSVDENSNYKPKSILEVIDRIKINYQVVWPLQLIFTPRVMELYNGVFRHLLKLHWAHESLCSLKFFASVGETPEILKASCRRLELLRFWCLSSLARLRTYFMGEISTPFDLQLNNYQHLKDMIKAHEVFIEKIHSRCLLDGGVNGHELIFNAFLPLCNDVYQYWRTGRAIPSTKLSEMEKLLMKSQEQFPRLMTRLEQE